MTIYRKCTKKCTFFILFEKKCLYFKNNAYICSTKTDEKSLTLKITNTMKHYDFFEIQSLAKRFLTLADAKNEQVSAFLNGSIKDKDVDGYLLVKNMYREFVNAVNEYYGESYDDSIDYDLAYSVLERA